MFFLVLKLHYNANKTHDYWLLMEKILGKEINKFFHILAILPKYCKESLTTYIFSHQTRHVKYNLLTQEAIPIAVISKSRYFLLSILKKYFYPLYL